VLHGDAGQPLNFGVSAFLLERRTLGSEFLGILIQACLESAKRFPNHRSSVRICADLLI
jgi:hypothetical protein